MREFFICRRFQKRRSVLGPLQCLGLLLVLSSVVAPVAHAKTSHNLNGTSPERQSRPSVTLPNLEDDASRWDIYHDGGQNSGAIANVGTPSLDGSALALSLESGDPYTGFQAYRELPLIDATTFEMQMSFYVTDEATIQGLEFTMNRWHANQRMEWALQWEQYGDGSLQEGVPPTWRLWTGQGWQDTGVTQALSLASWHTLTLTGDIFQGKVRYLNFACDTLSTPLSLSFPPTSSPGEKVVLGSQIDGNANEDPAQVYFDKVGLTVQ